MQLTWKELHFWERNSKWLEKLTFHCALKLKSLNPMIRTKMMRMMRKNLTQCKVADKFTDRSPIWEMICKFDPRFIILIKYNKTWAHFIKTRWVEEILTNWYFFLKKIEAWNQANLKHETFFVQEPTFLLVLLFYLSKAVGNELKRSFNSPSREHIAWTSLII